MKKQEILDEIKELKKKHRKTRVKMYLQLYSKKQLAKMLIDMQDKE